MMHQEASSWLVGNWVIGIGLNISRIQSLPNHVAVDLASHPAIDSFLTDQTLTPHWKVTPKKIHPKIALYFFLVIILWVKKGMDQNKHLVLPTAYVMFNFIGSSRPRPHFRQLSPGAALRVTRKRSHASPCVRRQRRWCMPCSQPARWLRSMLPGCVDSGEVGKGRIRRFVFKKKWESSRKMAQENVNCWILKLVRSNYIDCNYPECWWVSPGSIHKCQIHSSQPTLEDLIVDSRKQKT